MSNTPSTTEAYKAVIDFSKVTISISSTILAALISFLVFGNYELSFFNLLSPIVLLISIFLSLFGFGQAIPTLKDGLSRPNAIMLLNFSAYLLVIGIALIFAVSGSTKEEKKLEWILSEVSTTSKILERKLSPANCVAIKFKDGLYSLSYAYDSTEVDVVFSTIEDKIISMENLERSGSIAVDRIIKY